MPPSYSPILLLDVLELHAMPYPVAAKIEAAAKMREDIRIEEPLATETNALAILGHAAIALV